MKTRIAAAVAALILGAAPLAATAQTWGGRYTGYAAPGAIETTGPVLGYGPVYASPSCPQSSAAEGNANQQHFPVKQYGQTSGGYRC
ncbi:hypothetical protein [Methylorubrum salsuginis]|uniref:Uncharacterized protein n=1 Tax=Methylorubrum salsuginis TaxID=414703 RepID=A0A1I4C9U9_9HYPH|nr:hypothetical protein [Methylorubrum salsuginis]SFK76841.1 hypothetical protein SAMN04488125_10482 [Methylorubrum salsuginis]